MSATSIVLLCLGVGFVGFVIGESHAFFCMWKQQNTALDILAREENRRKAKELYHVEAQ